jgi:stage II sporulation protein D
MRASRVCVLAASFLPAVALGQTVTIGVLGLFRPQRLEIRSAENSTLVIRSGPRHWELEPGAALALQNQPGSCILATFPREQVCVAMLDASARDGRAVRFQLRVPGKLTRVYQGWLHITLSREASSRIASTQTQLVAVVAMDLELAVASAVAAESPPDAPLEALKAQAVASRSLLLAGKGAHANFDFCDTTHCQFLREPPDREGPASVATHATRSMVLSFQGQPFAALFSASCGGRTRTPAEIGLHPPGYPYYSVDCAFCRAHPDPWQRSVSLPEAEILRTRGETGRILLARQHGWDAVPGNHFSAHRSPQDAAVVLLSGCGHGHGVGLCQGGAGGMARAGADYRAILRHYFPNADILVLSPAATAH